MEFAFVALPLISLIFGGVQYGYLFWSLQTAKANARELARDYAVGNTQDACRARAVRQSDLPALGPVSVNTVYRDSSMNAASGPALGGYVTVTIGFQSLSVLPLVKPPNNGMVSQSFTEPISDLQSDPNAC